MSKALTDVISSPQNSTRKGSGDPKEKNIQDPAADGELAYLFHQGNLLKPSFQKVIDEVPRIASRPRQKGRDGDRPGEGTGPRSWRSLVVVTNRRVLPLKSASSASMRRPPTSKWGSALS